MISNIITNIPQDFQTISKVFTHELSGQEEAQLGYAAARILASFGMAYSAYIAATTISKDSGCHQHGCDTHNYSGILINAFKAGFKAGVIYTVSYDVFTMAMQAEQQQNPLNHMMAIGSTIVEQTKTALSGRQVYDIAHPWTQGTFYRSFWNELFK